MNLAHLKQHPTREREPPPSLSLSSSSSSSSSRHGDVHTRVLDSRARAGGANNTGNSKFCSLPAPKSACQRRATALAVDPAGTPRGPQCGSHTDIPDMSGYVWYGLLRYCGAGRWAHVQPKVGVVGHVPALVPYHGRSPRHRLARGLRQRVKSGRAGERDERVVDRAIGGVVHASTDASTKRIWRAGCFGPAQPE